ncbi:hypothetical protein Tco_0381600 [Tanacetum coccineum]
MHNNIMAAGSKERSTNALDLEDIHNGDHIFYGVPAVQQHTTIETVLNMTPENKEHFLSEKEAIFLLLTGCLLLRGESMESFYSRPSASIRHKGKEIAKPVTPQSESVSEEDSDPEQAQRDKGYAKGIWTLLAKGQFGNQRTMTVAGTRETVGDPVVQQTGIQFFNCKGCLATMQRECRKPKLCLKTIRDTDEVDDEQELEAHYSFMAKIQEVLPEESNSTEQTLEQVQNNDENNVFANEKQNSENNTAECADERVCDCLI